MMAKTTFSMALAVLIGAGLVGSVSAGSHGRGRWRRPVMVTLESENAREPAAPEFNLFHYLGDHPEFAYVGIIAVLLVLLVLGYLRHLAVRRLIVRLRSANAAKTRFLYNVSRDVRTPMSAIVGFTDIAMDNLEDRERLADSLAKIRNSSELLLSIISGVMDMSRIESGDVRLNEQPGDVQLSFVNIEKPLLRFSRAKGINLEFSFGNVADRYVYADYAHCGLVFVNLITNAVKYTNPGGDVRVRCEQTGRDSGGRALFRYTVSDNGVGMNEETQKHIFEELAGEYDSSACNVPGAGLGLHLCRKLIGILGGSLEFCSEEGKGSMFSVTLPFRVQNGTREYVDPMSGDKIQAKDPVRKIDLTGKRVLLAEDNELNREVAMFQLSAHGLLIDTAANGQTAVEMVSKFEYDFILMDIQMPVMDGYEATRRIREFNKSIPIIAISANALEEDREKSISVGMNDHINKPIVERELFDCMSRCYASV